MSSSINSGAVISKHRMEVAIEGALVKLRFAHRMALNAGPRKCLRRAIQNAEGALASFRHHNRKARPAPEFADADGRP